MGTVHGQKGEPMRLIDADTLMEHVYRDRLDSRELIAEMVRNAPTIEPKRKPERLTDDDFETIRIHLNAYKEKLCNQQRWEEANEYQRIIDRFMAFASVQPENRMERDVISRQAAIDLCLKGLNNLPSAQPERKTGRWLQISPAEIYECSECAQMVMTDDISCYKYCHGCGAYMGGKQDETN